MLTCQGHWPAAAPLPPVMRAWKVTPQEAVQRGRGGGQVLLGRTPYIRFLGPATSRRPGLELGKGLHRRQPPVCPRAPARWARFVPPLAVRYLTGSHPAFFRSGPTLRPLLTGQIFINDECDPVTPQLKSFPGSSLPLDAFQTFHEATTSSRRPAGHFLPHTLGHTLVCL